MNTPEPRGKCMFCVVTYVVKKITLFFSCKKVQGGTRKGESKIMWGKVKPIQELHMYQMSGKGRSRERVGRQGSQIPSLACQWPMRGGIFCAKDQGHWVVQIIALESRCNSPTTSPGLANIVFPRRIILYRVASNLPKSFLFHKDLRYLGRAWTACYSELSF